MYTKKSNNTQTHSEAPGWRGGHAVLIASFLLHFIIVLIVLRLCVFMCFDISTTLTLKSCLFKMSQIYDVTKKRIENNFSPSLQCYRRLNVR